jgi:phosphoglycolate phosphatase
MPADFNRTPPKLLVLFDIDQTLLHTGGAGSRALKLAAEEVLGRPVDLDGMLYAGRTDLALIGEILQRAGLNPDDHRDLAHAIKLAFFRHLPVTLEESTRGRLMPGVPQVLDLLSRNGVCLGLCTGNFRYSAFLKLSHFRLADYFAEGGFGDLYPDRADIARDAVRRCFRRFGLNLPADRVVLVGDTPEDVRAGKAIGARTVAVATGIFDEEALRAAGADLVLKDLSDAGGVVRVLVPGD